MHCIFVVIYAAYNYMVAIDIACMVCYNFYVLLLLHVYFYWCRVNYCMDGYMYVCMHVRMYACTYVCMYVCMCGLYRSGKEERPWLITRAKTNNQSINQSKYHISSCGLQPK